LALEIRPRKAGFVVLEVTAATRLLDWGVRNYGDVRHEPIAGVKKIAALFDFHSPGLVIIRQRSGLSKETMNVIGAIQQGILMEARRRCIECSVVEAKHVREFFGQYGCKAKYEVASILAEWFEDLAWQLPPRRRIWQSEAHAMLLFDAAAAGVTYLDVGPSN